MSSEPAFEVTQGFKVMRPLSFSAYSVTLPEWRRLKETVTGLNPGFDWYAVAGSFGFGVASASLVAALTASGPSAIVWCLCGLFFFCGICASLFSYKQSHLLNRAARDAVAQMEAIETRYGANPEKLEIIDAEYGAGDHQTNVTDKLRREILDNRIRIQATNTNFADPCPNVTKRLSCPLQNCRQGGRH